jgi:cob(I)alamin adenosyltransferase
MNKSKIYTKTGDKGTTGLYSGQRVKKSDPRIEALGCLDELNCCLGVTLSLNHQADQDPYHLDSIRSYLQKLQAILFSIGASVATPADASATKLEKVAFDSAQIENLEHWIDRLDSELPALTAFILPGGSQLAAQLHLSRAVCRRC